MKNYSVKSSFGSTPPEFIWESSITTHKNRRKIIALPKTRLNSLKKKPNNFYTEESFEDPKEYQSSKFPQRSTTNNETNKRLKLLEEFQTPEATAADFYKPSLEHYLIDQNSKFAIHSYARPKKLIAIKRESIHKHYEKNVFVKSSRVGVAGWKICKPKSFTPDFNSFKIDKKLFHYKHDINLSMKIKGCEF